MSTMPSENIEAEKNKKTNTRQELINMVLCQANDISQALYNFKVKSREIQIRIHNHITSNSLKPYSDLCLPKRDNTMEIFQETVNNLNVELKKVTCVIADVRKLSNSKGPLSNITEPNPRQTFKKLQALTNALFYNSLQMKWCSVWLKNKKLEQKVIADLVNKVLQKETYVQPASANHKQGSSPKQTPSLSDVISEMNMMIQKLSFKFDNEVPASKLQDSTPTSEPVFKNTHNETIRPQVNGLPSNPSVYVFGAKPTSSEPTQTSQQSSSKRDPTLFKTFESKAKDINKRTSKPQANGPPNNPRVYLFGAKPTISETKQASQESLNVESPFSKVFESSPSNMDKGTSKPQAYGPPSNPGVYLFGAEPTISAPTKVSQESLKFGLPLNKVFESKPVNTNKGASKPQVNSSPSNPNVYIFGAESTISDVSTPKRASQKTPLNVEPPFFKSFESNPINMDKRTSRPQDYCSPNNPRVYLFGAEPTLSDAMDTSPVKFITPTDTDFVGKLGDVPATFIKESKNKSLEELRLEDYIAGRRGPTLNVFKSQSESSKTINDSPVNTRNTPTQRRESLTQEPTQKRETPTQNRKTKTRHREIPTQYRETSNQNRETTTQHRETPTHYSETPNQNRETTTQHRETPTHYSETPNQNRETTPQYRETPTQNSETPNQNRETTTQHRKAPTQYSETATQHRETPTQYSETPNQNCETATQHRETPTQHRETPNQNRETATQHRETSTQYSETPNQNRETTTQHRETPTQYSETATQHRETPTQYREAPTQKTATSTQNCETTTQHPETIPKQRISDEEAALERLLEDDKTEEAIKMCNDALDLDPESVFFLVYRARAYYDLKQYREALEDAQKAVSLSPNLPAIGYLSLAKCCLALGQIASGEQAVRRAVERDPSVEVKELREAFASLRTNQERIHRCMSQHNYFDAVYVIDHCLKRHCPASSMMKLMKAECLAHMRKYEEARNIVIDLSLLCINLKSSDAVFADAMYVTGLCSYYQENDELATKHFRKVLQHDPDHEKAIKMFKLTKTRINTKLIKEKKELGNEAFNVGNWRKAMEFYDKALSIDKNNKEENAKLHYNRATVFAKQNQPMNAIYACTAALELDGNYIKALLRRAQCYKEMDMYEESLDDYELLYYIDSTEENKHLMDEANRALMVYEGSYYYYKVLGINKTATQDDIKKAYKKCALLYHPDKHASASLPEVRKNERKFKLMKEAYDVLSDPKSRGNYDRNRRRNCSSSDEYENSYYSYF